MKTEKATFAIGCFWSPDDFFSKLNGVTKTTAGYSGGTKENPTYHDLGDQTETVEIEYDPSKISYEELLKHFFNQHNPSVPQRVQYRSAIFYHNDEQKMLAEKALQEYEKDHELKTLTSIEPVKKFWKAEEYHQKYYQKNNVSGIC